VRLITRGGYNWTDRYPLIVEAALKNRQKRFIIDGEAVVLGLDGISDFDALHSDKHNDEAQLCAFGRTARQPVRGEIGPDPAGNTAHQRWTTIVLHRTFIEFAMRRWLNVRASSSKKSRFCFS
jgi:hypothetical protein